MPSAPNLGTLDKDVALPSGIEDTVQSLSWSPVADKLAAASWDKKVHIYDVAAKLRAQEVSTLTTDAPVLSCDWAKDGTKVIAGGADRKLHLLDMATNKQAVIGSHDAAVRRVRFVKVPGANAPIAVSGSWDRTVKFWDLRQPASETASAAITLNCGERVYGLDANGELLVVGTADDQPRVHLVDLKNPGEILKTMDTPLVRQTRAVAVNADGSTWALASIEGRCAINALNAKSSRENFTFKCHRDLPVNNTTQIWTINDIQFHPVRKHILATAGSDGSFVFWNTAQRCKARGYPRVPASPPAAPSLSSIFSSPTKTKTKTKGSGSDAHQAAITAVSFSHDGGVFAYAVGYDWCRGAAGNSRDIKTRVMLHNVVADDVGGQKRVTFLT
ncbi:WD40 repeat-like protein [Nemania sp. FL0031]|nr:WD40 repeat-like protein [Nemania sp. FL0031]